MNIAIISPYAYPEIGACVLRVSSLQEFLLKKNSTVVIFVPKRDGIESVGNVIRYANAWELFFTLLKSPPDVVIGTSPPMTHSFFALLAAKIRRKPFILDARDPWMYMSKNKGIYKETELKFFIFRAIEKLSYLLADRITVATEGIGRIIGEDIGSMKKIILAPNGADLELFKFSASGRQRIRKKLHVNSKAIVAIYSGSFIGFDVDKLITILKEVLHSNKNFYLIIRISVSQQTAFEKQKLAELISRLNLEKKVFLIDYSGENFSKQKETCDYFSASDMAFSTITEAIDFCIPVKNYEYLAMGLPTITKGVVKGESLKKMFAESKIGVVVDDWESFSKQVSHAVGHFKSFKRNYSGLRDIASKKYSRERTNEIILGIVKDITEQKA